jgi:hypothetical protein
MNPFNFFSNAQQAVTHKERWQSKRKSLIKSSSRFKAVLKTGSAKLNNNSSARNPEQIPLQSFFLFDGFGGNYGLDPQNDAEGMAGFSANSSVTDLGALNGSSRRKKKLGLAALTVLIFYEVCGGPFGIEEIVRAGGPFYALLGFSLLFVWAIPEALITAEMSTAMPEPSGSVG